MHCRNGFSTFQDVNHAFLNNDTEIVPEEAPMIILDINSSICMANKGKGTKKKTHCKDNVFCKEWRKVQDAQD